MNIKEAWNGLPKWGKIGIGVGALLVVFLGIRSAKSTKVVTPSQTALVPKDTGGKVGDADVAAQMNASIASLNKRLDESIGGLQKDVAGSLLVVGDAIKQQNQNQAATDKAQSDSFAATVAGLSSQVSGLASQTSGILSAVNTQVKQVSIDTQNQIGMVGKLVSESYTRIPPVVISLPSTIPHTENDDAPAKSSSPAPAYQDNQRQYLDNLRNDSSVSEATQSWANQSLYLENLKNDPSSSEGTKAWAESELATQYGN